MNKYNPLDILNAFAAKNIELAQDLYLVIHGISEK